MVTAQSLVIQPREVFVQVWEGVKLWLTEANMRDRDTKTTIIRATNYFF